MSAVALHPSAALERVFDQLRSHHAIKVRPALDLAARIAQAANDYAAAVEHEVAHSIAATLGLSGVTPPGPSTEDAVLHLHAVIAELPTRTAPVVSVVDPGTPSLVASQSAESAADDLWREVSDAEFDQMTNAALHSIASEWAARARSLKARGADTDHVIKKITAVAISRKLGRVLGLKLSDKYDWDRLVREAQAGRTTTQAVTQKTLPTAPIASVPEAHVVEHTPNLVAAAQLGTVVIVGGLVENKKLEWIERGFGFVPEWIETHDTMKAVQALASRVARGDVSAIVILDRLIGHSQQDAILNAARKTGTPIAYAHTAGCGAIRKAFLELEARLAGPDRASG